MTAMTSSSHTGPGTTAGGTRTAPAGGVPSDANEGGSAVGLRALSG